MAYWKLCQNVRINITKRQVFDMSDIKIDAKIRIAELEREYEQVVEHLLILACQTHNFQEGEISELSQGLKAKYYELRGRLASWQIFKPELFQGKMKFMKEIGEMSEGSKSVFLTMVSTRQLLEELKKREAVLHLNVEPHDDYEISTKEDTIQESGPATILIIND